LGRPLVTIFKMYILKLGILDGIHGLLLSFLSGCTVFFKYAKAWQMQAELKAYNPERILIVRADRIGDLLLATPAIRALKEALPTVKITLLTSDYAADAVKNNPDISEVLTISRKPALKEIRNVAKQIKQREIDLAIDFFPMFHTTLVLLLSGIKRRIGSASKWYQILYTQRLPIHRSRCEKSEIEYNLDMLKPIGVDKIASRPIFHITEEARRKVNQIFSDYKLNTETPKAALILGGGFSSRKLPTQTFAQLADILDSKGIISIAFSAKGQKDLTKSFKDKITNKKTVCLEGLDLETLGAALEKCDVVVTNSTGPLHIAAALDLPTVQIFEPRVSCSPKRWGYFGDEYRIIQPKGIKCVHCVEDKCQFFDCMDKIHVEEVASAVLELIPKQILR